MISVASLAPSINVVLCHSTIVPALSSPLPLSLHHASYQHCLVRCHSASPNAACGLRAVSVSGLSASLAALTQLPLAALMEFASSLHVVCPRTFTPRGWPRFRNDDLDFWCRYFAYLPWAPGWHIALGRELGGRIRAHTSHDLWKRRAFDCAQESVRHEHRPEAAAWMRSLRRQDCNYTRYQHIRGDDALLMTQWGDYALQLTV